MATKLSPADVKIIKEKLKSDFATRYGCELIFDDGFFFIGNKGICNRLDCFVSGYQLTQLRRYFSDELLIGRIAESLQR